MAMERLSFSLGYLTLSLRCYLTEKGKPIERWRRKVSGLMEFSYDSGTASFECLHVLRVRFLILHFCSGVLM